LNLCRSGHYYATHFRSFPHSLWTTAVIVKNVFKKTKKIAPERANVILLHSNHRHVSATQVWPSSGWQEQQHNYNRDVSESIHS